MLVCFGSNEQEITVGIVLREHVLGLETAIIDAAAAATEVAATYLDTILDEDRSDVYKLMALRFDVEG